MPRPGSNGERPDEEIEGPLEDAASVLHERVDLHRSLLDEAELGGGEVPAALAESTDVELAEAEAEEALETTAVLAPPARDQSGDVIDPEELEARLEQATEAAELLSLHVEEPLTEALLDAGTPLDELEAGTVEDALERRTVHGGREERAAGFGRPVQRRVPPPAPRVPSAREGGIDPATFRRLLESDRARLEILQAVFDEQGLRQRPEREDLSSLSAVDQHPADLGTETFDRERDLSIRDQVEGELAEVTKALKRLDDGTYGRCEACGRPIGADRLVAEPATRFCLDDQRELERELAVRHHEVELP